MTFNVSVRRTVRSSPDEVIGIFADSKRLARVPGVRVEVLEAGDPDGSGHLRRVSLGPVMLVERIVSIDPVKRQFNYHIEASRPPSSHERGEIRCLPSGTGSLVVWTSTARLHAGVLTPVAEATAKVAIAAAFHGALIAIDHHLLKGNTSS